MLLSSQKNLRYLKYFQKKNAKNLIQVTWLNWLENSTNCSFTISIKEVLRGSNLM